MKVLGQCGTRGGRSRSSEARDRSAENRRASDVAKAWLPACVVILAILTWIADLSAAQRPRRVESSDMLVTLILKSWKEAVESAKYDKQKPGWKRRRFDTRAVLSDVRFRGEWLIGALADGSLDHVGAILIHSSYIEGGLNFQLIPETPLGSVELPADWTPARRQTWIARANADGIKGLHVVRPALDFRNTIFGWYRGQFLTFNARRTLFRSDLTFSDVTIGVPGDYGEKTFRNGILNGDVTFDKVKWWGEWNMANAVAARPVRLSTIEGDLTITDMRFEREASFSDIKSDRDGQASFANTLFEGRASFSDIRSPLNLQETRFRGPAYFRDGSFDEDVDLTGAVFEDQASFQNSRFLKVLKLGAIGAEGILDFRNSTIRKLDFRNTAINLVEGRADFRSARIANLCVEDVVFANNVDFSDAVLGKADGAGKDAAATDSCRAITEEGKDKPSSKKNNPDRIAPLTSLRFVTFEGDAFFLRTEIEGDLHLRDVSFNRTADFTDASLPRGHASSPYFLFSFVRFNDLLIRWRQLPPISAWINPLAVADEAAQASRAHLEPLSRVLSRLEDSFRSRKLLTDANEIHYNAKLAALAEARRSRALDQRLELEAEWLLWGISSGYGTRIWPILGSALVVLVAFALLYMACTLERREFPESTSEFNLRLRLLETPRHYFGDGGEESSPAPRSESRLLTALRLSFVLLFKFGYRDTLVSGKLGFVDVRVFVVLEWIIGFYFLGCLTVTLANTQPLINKLISGVF